MRVRRDYGDKNCIGRNVVSLRKEKNIKQKILLAQLQLKGIDIGQSSLSALEGQRREASDREVLALSQIFQVPMERLFQPPGVSPISEGAASHRMPPLRFREGRVFG